MNFSILQKKSLSSPIKAVGLCPTMDLCAFILENGSLLVHRTITWELIMLKGAAELFHSSNHSSTSPTCLSFAPNGKVLAVGGDGGEVALVDLESAESVCTKLQTVVATTSHSRIAVISVSWGEVVPSRESTTPRKLSAQLELGLQSVAWENGGQNLVTRIGMQEIAEPGESLKPPSISFLLNNLKNNCLAVVTADDRLSLLLYGRIPLFTSPWGESPGPSGNVKVLGGTFDLCAGVPIRRVDSPMGAAMSSFAFGESAGVFSSRNNEATSFQRVSPHPVPSCASFTEAVNPPLLSRLLGQVDDAQVHRRCLEYLQQIAALWLKVENTIQTLCDIVFPLGKKWKESTKILLPKLGLLQQQINSYQLQMNLVEMLYSVVACGLWHPGAETHFTSHWNEQGLARARSGIETTSKHILWALAFRALPLVMNVLLHCRELLSLYHCVNLLASASLRRDGEKENASIPPLIELEPLHELMRSLEFTTYSLDSTITEAKRAWKRMLLFLQFVRECSITPDSPLAAVVKPDLAARPEYCEMFDPRNFRSSCSNPSDVKSSYAEMVTATHLYAYLAEESLPENLVRLVEGGCRQEVEGEVDLEMTKLRALFVEMDKSAVMAHFPGTEATSKRPADLSTGLKRSLVQNLQDVRRKCEAGMLQLHGVFSSVRVSSPSVPVTFQTEISGRTNASVQDAAFIPLLCLASTSGGETWLKNCTVSAHYILESRSRDLLVVVVGNPVENISASDEVPIVEAFASSSHESVAMAVRLSIQQSLDCIQIYSKPESSSSTSNDFEDDGKLVPPMVGWTLSIVGLGSSTQGPSCADESPSSLLLHFLGCEKLLFHRLPQSEASFDAILLRNQLVALLPRAETSDDDDSSCSDVESSLHSNSKRGKSCYQLKQRTLPLIQAGHLVASSGRGVAAVLSQNKTVLTLVDLENDEGSDDEEVEEEEGAESESEGEGAEGEDDVCCDDEDN